MRNVAPTIVVAHTPTQMEIYAGQELQKYLAEIFESSIEIIDEQFILAQEYLIYVGRTNKTLNSYSKCYAELTQDEFVIETKKEEAFLFGKENDYSQAATLYAVYDFLEKAYGVKFYSYDEELIPKTKFCGFPILSIREKPDFLMRQPLYASTRRYPTFTAKMRIKDCYCEGTPGGTLYPEWAGRQGHNFYELIPPMVYESEHPEWFDKENYQLCFSNEELTDEIIHVLKREIDHKPLSRFFALSQNDTVHPCQCEKCKKNYEKYTVSGTLIRFVNRVAKEIDRYVEERYPHREVNLVTFAYYFSVKPPVKKDGRGSFHPVDKSVIPYKNVYIFLSTIDYCFYHDLCDDSCEWNKDFKDVFFGWKSLVGGDRVMIWNYGINYAHYLYPFFNFKTIGKNIRFFRDNGIKYLIEHGQCEAEFVEMAELRTYLAAKLMWNADIDLQKEAEDFIKNYYKIASDEIIAYLKILYNNFEKIDKEEGYHLRVYHLPESMFAVQNFSEPFLHENLKILYQGLSKVEQDSDNLEKGILRQRILRVIVSVKYLILMNYQKYGHKDVEVFADTFLAEAKECGITAYKEYIGGQDIMHELKEQAMKSEVLKY